MTVQLHPHRRRFQSTLPREERPSLYLLGAHLHNFNPRSHERSDSQQSELITMLRISIHAPTRGATPSRRLTCLATLFQSTLPREERRSRQLPIADRNGISIHAPTRGATRPSVCYLLRFSRYFNPRSHERSDINVLDPAKHNKISIHAPTRGATYKQTNTNDCIAISIHAPTRGATCS